MSEPIVLQFDPKLRLKPWSTNQDRNMNPYKRAENISLWKTAALQSVKRYRRNKNNLWPFPEERAIVQIVIPFRDTRTRDPHNYCGTVLKAVVDGIVKGSTIPDDTPEYVGHREPVLVVAKQPVEVHLYREPR